MHGFDILSYVVINIVKTINLVKTTYFLVLLWAPGVVEKDLLEADARERKLTSVILGYLGGNASGIEVVLVLFLVGRGGALLPHLAGLHRALQCQDLLSLGLTQTISNFV